MGHKEAMIRHPCMPVHSLVADVLPIVIISKVVTIKNPLKLNHDSKTSEHHIPRVPAHTRYSLQAGHTCVWSFTSVCIPWTALQRACFLQCCCMSSSLGNHKHMFQCCSEWQKQALYTRVYTYSSHACIQCIANRVCS